MSRVMDSSPQGASTHPLLASTLRKVSWRLIPFLFLLYIMSYLDRVNVGFAALQMDNDLKFSSAAFGVGSGIFFIGYCLFEVPSNLVLARVGARLWIARIMVTWGLIAAAMMFVRTPATFYVLRFFLGVAEAGFFPGVIFYLSRWFPSASLARAIALFMTAVPASGVIGGPLSGALLGLNGYMGLTGWQWLFLVEGVPSVLLGIVALWYLTDEPANAEWLEADQRAALTQALAGSSGSVDHRMRYPIQRALLEPTSWWLGAVFFLALSGSYGYLIWSPQVIKSFSGAGNLGVGLISGLISLIVVLATIFNGVHSDRLQERRWHVVVPLLATCFGFVTTVLATSPLIALMCLSLIPVGVNTATGPFWSFVASSNPTSAAARIAVVATIANSGGFFGTTIIGILRGTTGTYQSAFILLGALAGVAAALAVWIMRASREHPTTARTKPALDINLTSE